MKKGCLITLITLTGLAILFIYGLLIAFEPEYDKAEIKQSVGGTLVCNSVYNADHHSWQYHVSYKYKAGNGSLVDMGSGTYYGREWKKDEQLVKFNNWTILKTGGWIGTDKIIIGNLRLGKWTQYEFSPENIEKDSLWQSLQIHSLLNWCCSEAFIDRINDGQIELQYKFRTDEKLVDKYDQRRIYYQINDTSGQPIMTKIE